MSMFALAFSPDGRVLAAAGADGVVYLIDTRTWKVARRLTGHPELIVALAFSPDGRRLASGGFSGLPGKHPAQVLLWDVAAGQKLRAVATPDAVWSLAFSRDGALLAHVTGEKYVALYTVES